MSGFVYKGLSPVKPVDRKLRVEWAFNVWGAACHHQASGGSGDPEWRAIFSEPAYVNRSVAVIECSRSDVLYDGTKDKYERHPKSDVRVLYCASLVEAAKAGERPIVTAFLLFKFPLQGSYCPELRGVSWSHDPARAFVERGRSLNRRGFDVSDKDAQRFCKWLRRRENDVRERIRGMIEDEGSPYGAETFSPRYAS